MSRHFSKLFVLALAGSLAAQITSRADAPAAALAKSIVLEGNVAYLRVGDVTKSLPEQIRAAQNALAVSNKIAGTVLDLRFADGDDSDSAKAIADMFASKRLPLAILVNGQTRGAAAALAADLRAARAGLIFESVAGAAPTNSQTTALMQPDITVFAAIENERDLMENPYAAPAPNDTNSPAATNNLLPLVDHTSEADLVRAKIKDGGGLEPVPAEHAPAPQKPFIRDPVLARAVDLIKGLAVVRTSHF